MFWSFYVKIYYYWSLKYKIETSLFNQNFKINLKRLKNEFLLTDDDCWTAVETLQIYFKVLIK